MQNVLQVFDARLAYMNFHAFDVVDGLVRVVGTKWSIIKRQQPAVRIRWEDTDDAGTEPYRSE